MSAPEIPLEQVEGDELVYEPTTALPEFSFDAELSPLEQAAVEDTLKIAKLEAQLAVALPMIEEQNAMLAIAADIVVTARAFVEVITAQSVKTGEAVFKTVHGLEDSDPIVQTLNYRFSDLAAALNSAGRPVPPKLAQGTVH
jgi:hypothetical protein